MKPANAEIKWDDHCAVCGKSVGHGEGFSHLNLEGEMIALCFETFEEDPAKFPGRRAVRKVSEDKRPPGSFAPFDL